MSLRHARYLLKVWLAAWLPAAVAWGQTPITIDASSLDTDPNYVRLEEGWRFQAGDDPAWAAPDFDDSTWLDATTYALPSQEEGWQGVGWYRLRLRRAADLGHRTLGFYIFQGGASEIYLDGELLERHGTVGTSREDEVAYWPRRPRALPLVPGEEHVLAVRTSNFEGRPFLGLQGRSGFRILVIDLDRSLSRTWRELGGSALRWKIWVGASLAFAVLHLCLFVYRPREVMNFHFAMLAVGFAGLMGFDGVADEATSPALVMLMRRLALSSGLTMILGFIGLIHAFTNTFWKKVLAVVAAIGVAAAILVWWFPSPRVFQIFTLAATTVMLPAGLRGSDIGRGRWILAVGSLSAGIAGVFQILSDLRVFGLQPTLVYPYGMLLLLLCVSIYLGRRFAETQRDLEARLVEVQKLSEQALEQERKDRQREIERRLLAADNARKTAELEQARQLQLSLLPTETPDIPSLDVSFEMRPAREVGGDYCDYLASDDGTFNLALGDATGHGLDAGMVVMATKSLFQAVPEDADVCGALERMARGVESMGFRRMHMALSLLRLRDGHVQWAAAGMPPLLVYRAARDEVEELELSAPPLGAIRGHEYQQHEIRLGPGDALLLTTDGLPEALDPQDEMLGYEALQRHFGELASKPAKEVVAGLIAAADAWADGRVQEDDMTVVVLKARSAENPPQSPFSKGGGARMSSSSPL